MLRKSIPFDELTVKFHHFWDSQWLVLTCGDFTKQHFNSMTVSWGSLGTMWNKPFAQVVVRPTRYTYQFMEQYDNFTLCAFSSTYRKALEYLGAKSGRDVDKIVGSGLTSIASSIISSPCYAEAEMVIECRKIYWQDMEPSHFLNPEIENHYSEKNYHRIYYGEIIAIFGK